MTATLTAREQLAATAEKFCKDHEDAQGLLSAEDQATFDGMLTAAKQLPNGRSFRTQSDADAMTLTPNGLGSGARLIDDKGRAVRGLLKNESFAYAVREQAHARGINQQEQRIEKMVDSGELTMGGYLRALVTGARNEGERAALSGADGTAGGYSVPSFLSAQIIDLFRARVVMMQAGAQTIPLQSDTHSYCRLTGDATAAWRQESTVIAESGQTFGGITFYPKSLAVYVKVSRELLQDSPNIEESIQRSFVESFKVALDRVGLVGEGAAAEPMGLYNYPDINELAAVGSLDYYRDFLDGYKLCLDDNSPPPTAVIHSNREWRTMAGWLDGDGRWLEKPPAIRDLPFLTTSSIPTTQGSGADSCAFMGHFPDFVFGMRSELQIEVLKELFAQNHQYGFVAHLRCDTGVFHPGSFCKITGITAP